MPLFVVRLVHPPDQCPASNAKVRERATTGAAEIPRLAQQHGIKFLAGPLVLDSEHESLAVVEAARIEAIHDFVAETGLLQWNAVRVTFALPIEESMKELAKIPPPLY
jgi:hypothetical protein